MDPIGETEQERAVRVSASNQYRSYMHGWRDGASDKATRPAFTTHSDATIRAAYEAGYTDGQIANQEAREMGSDLYGHRPSYLR